MCDNLSWWLAIVRISDSELTKTNQTTKLPLFFILISSILWNPPIFPQQQELINCCRNDQDDSGETSSLQWFVVLPSFLASHLSSSFSQNSYFLSCKIPQNVYASWPLAVVLQCVQMQLSDPWVGVSVPGIGSQWQQAKQGNSDVLVPGNTFQFVLEDPDVFPGQVGYTIPPAGSGYTPGSPTGWTCL